MAPSFEQTWVPFTYHDNDFWQNDFTPPAAFGTNACFAHTVHVLGVNLAGKLILVLCEYPSFEDFDNEVFLGGEDVIFVRGTAISLSVVEIAIEREAYKLQHWSRNR